MAGNAAWNVSSAAVFIFDDLDTITGDNFGDLGQITAGVNTDAGAASGSLAGRTVVLALSNVETTAIRRTGLYVWTDTDGDSGLEASDTVRLLGVVDGIASDLLTTANLLIV